MKHSTMGLLEREEAGQNRVIIVGVNSVKSGGCDKSRGLAARLSPIRTSDPWLLPHIIFSSDNFQTSLKQHIQRLSLAVGFPPVDTEKNCHNEVRDLLEEKYRCLLD
jgi:hypothetical protein